jgi:UDP-glucuronate decarboxylase
MAMMDTQPGFTGPVNLGNPIECTMLELARKVLDLTGSSSRIVSRPLPADDPRQRRPEIRIAREDLAWVPKVSLEQGLLRTIRYFDRLLSQETPTVLMERARLSVGLGR